MTREEIFERVKEVIVDSLSVEPEQVTLEAKFRDDLRADSLDLAELIMDFEDKFGVGTISEEDAMKIQTVGDAVDYIYKELQAA